MSMYKEANRAKLRIQTPKGVLSTEQLWDLSMTDLATTIKSVKKLLKNDDDDGLSFLDENKTVDQMTQLSFNILKDVYLTKKEEKEKIKLEAENKAFNQKILEKIHSKQERELDELSIDDLKAMLK